MSGSDAVSRIGGAGTVREWFGFWPDFHDAEVISVLLARTGPSVLRVYPYYPAKPATVDFILEGVTDVELSDFSSQNVISSLAIESVTNEDGDEVYRLTLGPCFGLAGRIDAKSLRIALTPGKSSDHVSLW